MKLILRLSKTWEVENKENKFYSFVLVGERRRMSDKL